MKRPGWIVGITFLVCAVILVHTGWLASSTSAATAVGPVSTEVKPTEADRLHAPVGWSYRHHQSTSWRASILQQ